MASELKVSKEKKNKNTGEMLVRRGCPVLPPSSTLSPSVERLKQNNPKSCEMVQWQCDSGFGDDDELQQSEKQTDTVESDCIKPDEQHIKTLEETTRNLRIDSREETDAADNRQPISFDCERNVVPSPSGGHFLNYASGNDPRYLLAPLRELLFRQDDDGDTALHIAVIHGQYQTVDGICSIAPCCQCLDIFNDLRQTPLHLAVITKQPAIVRRLLAAGVSIDLRDRNGKTALHLASERGDEQCVEEITRPLLEKDKFSDDIRQKLLNMLDARDYHGFTALHLAVKANSQQVVGHLAQVGADVNCQDGTSGRSPLHLAVELNNLGMANWLLFQCKSFANSVRFDGCTPLHVAAGRGLQSLVAILLAAGADPSFDNYEGITPHEYATDEVIEMLES